MSCKKTPQAIDALLPQTQCGLCGYGGCMPYAEALANLDASIDLCPPGGVSVLNDLGQLLEVDASPFIAEMMQKSKPKMKAYIREDECIGCVKCIKACPVDAILGTGKRMHTVIQDYCTGCELCVAPCPVDCIDMVEVESADEQSEKDFADASRERFQKRNLRLLNKDHEKEHPPLKQESVGSYNKLDYIRLARERVAGKRK